MPVCQGFAEERRRPEPVPMVVELAQIGYFLID